ncbi:armadillo-type protein [Syncephalis plumigaleata]|nr:armadillo-type protein [Syncephalis plumigaleata]
MASSSSSSSSSSSEEGDIKLLKETVDSGKEAEQLYRHLLQIEHGQESKTRRINLLNADAISTLVNAAFNNITANLRANDIQERIWLAKSLFILVGNPENEIQSVMAAIATTTRVDTIGSILGAVTAVEELMEGNQELVDKLNQLAVLAMDITTRLLVIVQSTAESDLSTSIQHLTLLQPCTNTTMPEVIRAKAMQLVLGILTTNSTHYTELNRKDQSKVKGLALVLLAKLAENPQNTRQQKEVSFTTTNSSSSRLRTLVEQRCTTLVGDWMDHEKAAMRVTGLRVLGVLFQMDTSLALAALGPEGIQKLVDAVELSEYETSDAQSALVNVLSHACDDKTCRTIIAQQCHSYLLARLREVKSLSTRIAAAIALTKIAQSASSTGEAQAQAEKEIKVYLFLDRSIVKELISQDKLLLKGLSSLAKHVLDATTTPHPILIVIPATTTLLNDHGISYGIISILDNITSYPVELTEEQKQLRKLRAMAQTATRNKNNKKDASTQGDNANNDDEDDDGNSLNNQAHVERRVTRVVEAGLLSVILRLAKHSSIIVRQSAAIAHRGIVLQHGGVRVLLSLATERVATSDASTSSKPPYATHADMATQALAKLAITIDPRIGFPGELSKELVRPFVRVCSDTEQLPLRQFECLLALTNLASVSEDGTIAQRIVTEGGVEAANALQFSCIALVQRAATELVCNLMMYPAVAQLYTSSRERIKLLIALADTEDPLTRSAAAGALAILSAQPDGARSILNGEHSITRMIALLNETNDEQAAIDVDGLRHRGAECLRNIVALDKSAAEQVIRANALPALMKIVKTSQYPPLLQCVGQLLATLKQYQLINI